MKLTHDRRDKAFRESLTWAEFLDTMKVNRPAIEANFRGFKLSAKDKAFIATLPGITDVLVLAHDWCGDVVANLPLFAKIEQETGKIRLRILLKDPDNTDIGLLYPHPDGDVHIPIYIFFDAAGDEKDYFIERTPDISKLMETWIAQFWADNPGLEGKGKEFSTLAVTVRTLLLKKLASERTRVRELEKDSILALLGKILL